MLDRHSVNHLLQHEIEPEVVSEVYDCIRKDYADQPDSIAERNMLNKQMFHDFLLCWCVDWHDDLQTYFRFIKEFDFTDKEIMGIMEEMYAHAEELELECVEESASPEKIGTWLTPADSYHDKYPIKLCCATGGRIYGCLAHDLCWFLAENWLDKAIDDTGSCEQETKLGLYLLTMSSTVKKHQIESYMLKVAAIAFVVSGAFAGITFMLSHNLFAPIAISVVFAYFTYNLIVRIKEFIKIAKFFIGVKINEGDIPLPEAVKHINEES